VQRLRRAVGHSRGRHRGDRVQAGGRQRHAPQEEHRQRGHGEPYREARRQLAHDQHQGVEEPEVRMLERLDAPDDQQDRDGVVHARLALERARESAAQRRPPQDGEHGGRVGRRHGRAEQQGLERLEVEQQRRGDRSERGRAQRPQRGQRDRRAQDGADLAEAGGQAALEEDEGERDHPDRARELEVAELDQAEPVGPDHHTEREHQHQARHPQATGGQRRCQAGGQQDPDDEDELTLVQAGNPARRRCVRCPG
jgi:hypothetical protein